MNELELQTEARLGQERPTQTLAVMTGDDHGFANTRGFEGTKHAHTQRHTQHGAQRLRQLGLALPQPRAGACGQHHRPGYASFCHGQDSLSLHFV
jgi:hypothetical protein